MESVSRIKISHETTQAPAGNALVKHPDNIGSSPWRRVTVAWLRSGFEGGSSSTIKGYDLPFATGIGEAAVRDVARALVRPFKDEPESWADAQLKSIEQIEKGETYSIWRVRIEQAYTD